jgi:FAD/FMN-containing dehydrogenase
VDTKKRQLAAIVGENNVLDDRQTLEEFSKDESFSEPLLPWFVARPGKESEVQALVKWANATGTPLVPVSSGAPHFYGDTVPTATEAVIVDLSRMKAIKRIDRRNRIAVIEPGVTFSELAPALAKEGLRIPRPLLPRANKSVVASLLERQPTTIPRLNFSLPEPLRTCGVVWGSGELAFTGEAGLGPPSLEDQWRTGLAQVDPRGPIATDLMRLVTGAQGSMGIVVWASIKLELVPSVRSYFFVPHDDISGLIDLVYKLTKIRLGDETMLLNRAKLAALLEPQPAACAKLREALPEWVALVGLAGTALFPEERLKVQEKEFRSAVQQFGLTLCSGFPGVGRADVARLVDGDAGERPRTVAQKGATQDIFFLTTLDKAPRFIETVQSVAAEYDYPISDIGIYVQPQHQGVSHHVESNIPYDPNDASEVAKVKNIYLDASTALVDQGAYFSRPYGYWSELVYQRDATSTELLRTVKHILDPTNIMNPGKPCF